MKTLNPTLWRTCKMLAGQKRIQLLRQLYGHPGRNVSELGAAVGIKRACASQELRRIQSRGLLKAKRQGLPLIYRMETDPQVPSASPLLHAIRSALASRPPERDLDMCRLAQGLAHERRIAIARVLLIAPRSAIDLNRLLRIAAPTLAKHLRILVHSGWAIRKGHLLYFKPPPHPLAQALANLLKSAP
ncbi:MAG: hypothetical protein AB7V14_02320 [Kiritimatiellia bacterium]